MDEISKPDIAAPEAVRDGGGTGEAHALVDMAAAEVMARTEKLWVRKRGMEAVSWEAMRLQFARGRQQRLIAVDFGVDEKSLSWRKAQGRWRRLPEDKLADLSRTLAAAIPLRRAMKHQEPDPVADAAACAWTPLTEAEALAEVRARRSAANVARVAAASAPDVARAPWADIAHPAQLPPAGPWRTWMMMGGRGAGKTRAGAEWVRGLVERGEAKRIALVGPTLHDVREVMIDGPSGLCGISAAPARPKYEAGRRRLVWPDTGACAGAVAYVFSAEDPDSLRGPQFDAAWCDEAGAWARDVETWRTLAFGMRLGEAPRIVVTTTPRPRALVRLLHARAEAGRGGVVLTQAGTRANAANLAPDFVAWLEEDYGGTELGRQELDGELIEDAVGALWSRAVIERNRARAKDAEGLERIVVAVDPPAGASARSDACGIVVAGVRDGVIFVLADASVRGLRPAEWAKRVMRTADAWGASQVIAESNQGGEMVRDVLQRAEGARRVRVKLAHASIGKRGRAEPVSVLYERGRVRHVHVLKELEDEMCAFTLHAPSRARSPDRVDALVWAVTELTAKRRPRLEVL